MGSPEIIDAVEVVLATLPTWSGPADTPVFEYSLAETRNGYTFSFAGRHMVRPDLGAILDLLEWYINQQVIEGLHDGVTGIHASAASRAGQLVVMPAMSGSGKSTTVAALVRAGWDYFTDELVLLDHRTLTVSAYPKPIALNTGSWPLFPEATGGLRSEESCLVPASALGGVVAKPGPVTLVVCPQYTKGAATRLEPLSPADVTMLIAQSTFVFNLNGAANLRATAAVARTAPGYRLIIGDLDDAVAAIDELANGLSS
jgi:hypothetical protein